MEILILTLFVSAALVAAALLFFAWNVRAGSHQHAELLALLPLQRERREADPHPAEPDSAPQQPQEPPSWK